MVSYYSRFIQARNGRRGKCELCFSSVEKLEAHHVCYSPEKTLNLCHACHFQVHSQPRRFNKYQKLKLVNLRLDSKSSEEFLKLNSENNSALAELFAPSRNLFIHSLQKL